MATLVASGTDRKSSERKFYSRMALFLVFVVLLGFGPSFYLRNVVPAYPRPNPTLPPAVIFHGLVFTSWMALIVAQTQLIAARKHAVHMQLGTLGMLLGRLLPYNRTASCDVPAMVQALTSGVAPGNNRVISSERDARSRTC